MRLVRSIILEGPNGGGKSTLLKALVEGGVASFHTGGPKRDANEVLTMCDSVRIAGPCILDRVPMISQVAYDRALDRVVLVPEEKLFALLPRFSIVVYCRPPLEELLSHTLHAGPTHPSDHVQKIQANKAHVVSEYDRLINELSARGLIRVMLYDYTAGATPARLIFLLEKSGDLKCAD